MLKLGCSLLLLTILSACGTAATPTATLTPQESAWTGCTLFIDRQLDISFLDAQRYTPSGVEDLGDNQYRVKVHYAEIGSTYQCELLRRSDGNWQLLSLEEL